MVIKEQLGLAQVVIHMIVHNINSRLWKKPFTFPLFMYAAMISYKKVCVRVFFCSL